MFHAAVDANQHVLISRMVLAIHDPALPRMGVRAQAAQFKVQEIVQQSLKSICGIALSNHFKLGKFIACHAIASCGSWFQERSDHEKMVEFLQTTERDTGWGTANSIKSLKKVWGWS